MQLEIVLRGVSTRIYDIRLLAVEPGAFMSLLCLSTVAPETDPVATSRLTYASGSMMQVRTVPQLEGECVS